LAAVEAWTGTTMEPFVIGSLWGNLSDDNKGTLVSTGASFTLKEGEHRGRCSLQQFVGG